MAVYEITNEARAVDFECGNNTTLARALQHGRNLLRLRRGELPFDRKRGFDWRLFDLPLADIQAPLNRELARLMQYEPDLTLVRGWVERTENGETVIHALVSCRLT